MDYVANPAQLITATLVGFVVLLFLIIKLKLHALLSVLIAGVIIGVGSGMPFSLVTQAVTDGMGNTLKGIALIVGLGSMFGGILEVSGAAQAIADKLVKVFGEKNSAFALGLAGVIIGIPVFFDPAFIILMPIVYSIAKKTNKSLLYYVLPMTAGLGIGSAIPPTPAPMLITGSLPVDLGTVTIRALVLVIPKYLISYAVAVPFAKKMYVPVPENAVMAPEKKEGTAGGPSFGLVISIVLLPILLILISASAGMMTAEGAGMQRFLDFCVFIGQPYLALIIANVAGIIFLCVRKGITMETVESVLAKSLQPVAMIVLVTSAGGVLRYVLDYSGMGTLIGNALQNANLSIILVAYIISTLMRIGVGSTTVALTMTLGIVASFPQISTYSPMYLACIGMSAMFGATSFSHVNDSGFWLTKEYMGIDLKTAFKSWTLYGGFCSILSFIVLYAISFIWA